MNPSSTSRRRRWPWILAAILVTPCVAVALAAASYLSLNRDAAVLRREVMAATGADWQTKIQLSLGRATLWVARTCLACVPDTKMAEAQAALRVVRSVSVGVYRTAAPTSGWSREKLFAETDRTMQDRGWRRLVGVADRRESVLVYLPADSGDLQRICLAVVQGRELVVVSASLDPGAMADFVSQQLSHGHRRYPPSLLM